MNVRSLTMHALRIPFRIGFKHHSAERVQTQAVLAVVETDSGLGVGEGCPREYVTGEDVETCFSAFSRWRGELMSDIHTVADLERWVCQNEALVDAAPAAWCAVELALLDALAKDQERTVEALLRHPELIGPFRYTAVLGDAAPDVLAQQVGQYAGLGFFDYKIKITGDSAVDAGKVRAVRAAVPEATIRLDANNLWHEPADVLRYLTSFKVGGDWVIEEPLQPMDYSGLALVAAEAGSDIVLDESFTRSGHFRKIPDGRFIINVRVSKMGGLLRSLAVAAEAKERAIPVIVGAQVGETSILTRAALTVAEVSGGNLLGQEGAFGTRLLERDIATSSLMFGKAGQLDPGALLDDDLHGWQLEYDLPGLETMIG